MFSFLKFLGFTLLFLRFSYWIGSSLTVHDTQWKKVLLGQCLEGLLLFFIFTQLFGQVVILPMQHSIWVEIVGLLLVAGSVVGLFLAKRQLGDSWIYASSYKIKTKQQLVTKGIYSLTRHPIYVCFVLSYVGAEVLAGSWLWVSMLFLFIPFYFQAKKEDELLLKHFKQKYLVYRGQTKMFVPWIF